MISLRSWLVLAIALAACELEPPPKPAPPAPPAVAATAPTPAPPPVRAHPVAPIAPRPVPAPVQHENPVCLAVGTHFADVTIAAAKGPTHAQLEHDRTTIVRQTEDNCNAQHWSEAVIACFLHAQTAAALHGCDRELSGTAAPAPAHAPAPVTEGHRHHAQPHTGATHAQRPR